MKKLLILFLFGVSLFSNPIRANASTIFTEPMQGIDNTEWVPANFSIVNSTTPATHKSNGIVCLNGSSCQYEAAITEQDNIITFDVDSDGNPVNLLFSCRDANNYSDEVRAFLHTDGTTHLEWFSSGNGMGSDGALNYNYSQGIHHFELDCSGGTFSLKEDNSLLVRGSYFSPVYGSFNYIRFNLWQGNWIYSNYQFCDSAGCNQPIPKNTPTPTPTPEVNLNVPLIKQTDTPWQSQEYDTAHLWTPSNPTIHDWGMCAHLSNNGTTV